MNRLVVTRLSRWHDIVMRGRTLFFFPSTSPLCTITCLIHTLFCRLIVSKWITNARSEGQRQHNFKKNFHSETEKLLFGFSWVNCCFPQQHTQNTFLHGCILTKRKRHRFCWSRLIWQKCSSLIWKRPSAPKPQDQQVRQDVRKHSVKVRQLNSTTWQQKACLGVKVFF